MRNAAFILTSILSALFNGFMAVGLPLLYWGVK